ncbi:MAG: clan AA aspartic protease, partial [Candidatus Eremiobacteraeota bacterium]|nr:clan AA aspartic protease [Candidatus Eremiobacteraeota bacterium]
RTLGNLQVAPYAVTAPHGTRLDALLDPRTGLLAGVARGLDVIYRYEGQRRVGPCTLPFTVRRGDATTEVYADRQLASQPLAFPSGPPVSFAASGAVAHLEPGSLFRFGCRIEGVPARCVLDTGAAGLAMSLDLADQLGKKLLGQVELQGLGPVATAVVRADSLAMGAMRLGPALYAVIPDAGGLGADVVVGSDALARAVVRVDPRRHTVVFAPAGTPLAGTTLPLLFDGQIPRVPIVLGTNSVDLVLDTGDDASIDVNAPFLEQHPGLVRIRGRHAVVGVGGRGMVPAGSIARVDFGGINLSDVAADVNDLAQHPAPRIGAAFLAHFAFDMDYTEGRMSVRPLR